MRTWITASLTFITALSSIVVGSSLACASPSSIRWPASTSGTSQSAATMSKREMIQRLQLMQTRHSSEIDALETSIKKQLQDSMSLGVAKDVAKNDTRFATARAGQLAKKIDELNKRRTEVNARREIIDRLIFAIDSKYTNQPLQVFLEQQFLDMAATDLAEGRDSRMWKAYTYLSIAIREVPEPREDMFSVVEGFMNYTSMLDPKTPAEFLASRNYTNGLESVAANPMSREDAGSNDTRESNSSLVSPLVLELRMPMPKTTTASADAERAAQNRSADATLSGATQSATDIKPATTN